MVTATGFPEYETDMPMKAVMRWGLTVKGMLPIGQKGDHCRHTAVERCRVLKFGVVRMQTFVRGGIDPQPAFGK